MKGFLIGFLLASVIYIPTILYQIKTIHFMYETVVTITDKYKSLAFKYADLHDEVYGTNLRQKLEQALHNSIK